MHTVRAHGHLGWDEMTRMTSENCGNGKYCIRSDGECLGVEYHGGTIEAVDRV